MLFDQKQTIFAQGSVHYRFKSESPSAQNNRIFLPISIDGLRTEAALDTGAIYLIVNPELTEDLGLGSDREKESTCVNIRGVDFHGSLMRVQLEFEAEFGLGCQIQATLFLPEVEEIEKWKSYRLPNFLGFSYCMERLRFALDAENDLFYFGAGSE
jgi:hypothetical protein